MERRRIALLLLFAAAPAGVMGAAKPPALASRQQQQQQLEASACGAAPQQGLGNDNSSSRSVLILDVNSMAPPRADGAGPVRAAADCCAACERTNGCAGWAFCAAAGGCGAAGSCSAYVRKHPKLSKDLERIALPVEAFGPFARGDGCAARGGRWPERTCTLWASAAAAVSNSSSSIGSSSSMSGSASSESGAAVTAAEAAGWVSGTSRRPAVRKGCPAGLSADACAACAAARDRTGCLDCAARARLFGARAAARACAACADLGDARLRDACASCVADFSPSAGCGTCLIREGGGGRSARIVRARSRQCFECVLAGGAAARNGTACAACFSPSVFGGRVDAQRCLACASDAALPPAARAGCAGCHDAAARDRAGCLECAARARGAEAAGACGGCSYAAVAGAGLTRQCYGCLETVGDGGAAYCAYLGQVRATRAGRGAVSADEELCAGVAPVFTVLR